MVDERNPDHPKFPRFYDRNLLFRHTRKLPQPIGRVTPAHARE